MPEDLAANSDNSNLNVIFKTLEYSNQEVCRIDRQDVGQILLKQPQILKIVRCLFECFKVGSFVSALIPQLLVRIQNTAIQLYLNKRNGKILIESAMGKTVSSPKPPSPLGAML